MTDRALISPSPLYDPLRELQRNRRIEELLRAKADVSSLLAWTGMPVLRVTGTNAAFSVPPGNTPTPIPLGQVTVDNPDLVDAGQIKPAYDVTVQLTFRLRHTASSGGPAMFYVHDIRAGVVGAVYGYAGKLSANFDVADVYLLTLTAGEVFQLGLTHDQAGAVTFDLTKSSATILQVTANPAYLKGNERVP
jgi:hypothetical protein